MMRTVGQVSGPSWMIVYNIQAATCQARLLDFPSVSVEALVRRDRMVAAAGLAGITLLAWAWLVHVHGMDMGGGMGVFSPSLTFLMWAIMMMGMMVPSAAPMILVFATINRRRSETGGAAVATGIFVAGYLVAWTAFSALATAGQWGLERAAAVSPDMLRATPFVGGLLLIVAGIYQVTPLKRACLARCQSPLGFVLNEWREGAAGAFVMGLRHGAFCVGCCWLLMALLFVAGVMNLFWVATIAAFVLAEKLVPLPVVSWGAGVVLVASGVWLLSRGL